MPPSSLDDALLERENRQRNLLSSVTQIRLRCHTEHTAHTRAAAAAKTVAAAEKTVAAAATTKPL